MSPRFSRLQKCSIAALFATCTVQGSIEHTDGACQEDYALLGAQSSLLQAKVDLHKNDSNEITMNSSTPSYVKTRHVYGKYYKTSGGESGRITSTGEHKDEPAGQDFYDNMLSLYRPARVKKSTKVPVIIGNHPGGDTAEGASFPKLEEYVEAATGQGIACLAWNYRLATNAYFYEDGEPEEQIHISDDFQLYLDTSGKTWYDYKVLANGIHEHLVRAFYDAAMMIEYLIAHADELGIDVHRITFNSLSSGGAMSQYLAWIYHRHNVGRFTPLGMVQANSQFYPAPSFRPNGWEMFTAGSAGRQTKLSDLLVEEWCSNMVGNRGCVAEELQGLPYDLCNASWHDAITNKICGEAYTTSTIGDLIDEVWTLEPQAAKFYDMIDFTKRMVEHHPDQFRSLVNNACNDTTELSLIHHSIFGPTWRSSLEAAGMNYTVYYGDFLDIPPELQSPDRYMVEDSGKLLNYWSNEGWKEQEGWSQAGVYTLAEHVWWHCSVMGLKCNVDEILAVLSDEERRTHLGGMVC